jgi:hypothetical protein
MSNYLVIVESPTKVTSIKKYLGSRYKVMASQGHVRDLPKSQIGIDLDQDYEPHYITIRGKGDILSALRKEVKKADKIYLATDPDREGEAIAWHLKHALNLDDKDVRRVSFNEITKDAVNSRSLMRVILIWIRSMPSRQGVLWIASSATRSVRFCGQRSKEVCLLAAFSLLRYVLLQTERRRSTPLSLKSIGIWMPFFILRAPKRH